MKQKKIKPKGARSYANGGGMEMFSSLLGAAAPALGAVNPLLGGAVTALPALLNAYQNYKDKRETVVTGTPGNYRTGGTMNNYAVGGPIPLQSQKAFADKLQNLKAIQQAKIDSEHDPSIPGMVPIPGSAQFTGPSVNGQIRPGVPAPFNPANPVDMAPDTPERTALLRTYQEKYNTDKKLAQMRGYQSEYDTEKGRANAQMGYDLGPLSNEAYAAAKNARDGAALGPLSNEAYAAAKNARDWGPLSNEVYAGKNARNWGPLSNEVYAGNKGAQDAAATATLTPGVNPTTAAAKVLPTATAPRGYDSSGRPVLSVGSRGQEVENLQKFLKEKGFYQDGAVDQIYGRKTEAAVKAYQESLANQGKKITVDGIIGDETRAALSETAGDQTWAAPGTPPPVRRREKKDSGDTQTPP